VIPVLTRAASRAYDRYLIDERGIASSTLIDRAARGALDRILQWLTQGYRQVTIFAGSGNNGADGRALARLLEGYVEIQVYSPEDAPTIDQTDASHTIVVDALLGTGSKLPLREDLIRAVQIINDLKMRGARVLAIDIPTGLDADTGEHDAVVHADATLTMAAVKPGLFANDASRYVGELTLVPLTDAAADRPRSIMLLVERSDVIAAYPARNRIGSKFDLGHVLAVCGSRGMAGAAIMSAEAALRSGCGLVTVATAASERHIVAQAMPELMTVGLDETSTGAPTTSALQQVQHLAERATVLVIGSGMKPEPETAVLLREIVRRIDKPIVADAGALHAISTDASILDSRKAPTILTPHAGELAQLCGIKRAVLEEDRSKYALRFACDHGVIVVSKGAPTYTVLPEGSIVMNSTGNVGLATAGSGDVLGGMIAGVFAQQPEKPAESSWLAVYLHGLAADIARTKWSTIGMTARDVTMSLGEAYRSLGLY